MIRVNPIFPNLSWTLWQWQLAWGYNYHGECNVPVPNTDFIAIAAGECYSMGLKQDGTVLCWGANYCGSCTVPDPNSSFFSTAARGNNSIGLQYGCTSGINPNDSITQTKEVLPDLSVEQLRIEEMVPNPTRQAVNASYFVEEGRAYTVTIYDVMGRLVRVIEKGIGSGLHQAVWNGCLADGERVDAGVYFVQILAGQRAINQKVVIPC